MTTNTIKFSEFVALNLSGTMNSLVGINAPSGGENVKVSWPIVWSNGGRPLTPPAGTIGYNSDRGQYEYYDGVTWIQFAAGGSGSVNSGLLNQIAYYASDGTAVSGLPGANNGVLITGPTGTPSISTDGQIPGTATNNNASAGNIGEFVSSIILFPAAVPILNNTSKTITTISLTAGDWDVWGNAGALYTGTVISFTCWVSGTEFSGPSVPDFTLRNDITLPGGSIAGSAFSFNTPMLRFTLNASATIYLQCLSGFSSGTASACGAIYARRAR